MGLSIYHWLLAYAPVLGLSHPQGAAGVTSAWATSGSANAVKHEDEQPPLSTPLSSRPEPFQQTSLQQPQFAYHPVASGAPPWIYPRPGQETFEQVTLIRGIAARIAQEMALSNCSIFDVTVLAEVLELPFDQAWPVMRPMALVTSQLLRYLSRRRPLKRSEGTWLSFQIAYLRALDALLHQEAALHRPWLTAAQIPLGQAPTLSQEEALENASLRALIETLRPQRLTDTQAEQALTAGAQSLLVQQIHQVMVSWFLFNGAEERQAQLLIQRLEHGLAGHLLAAIAENATPLAQLQKFVRLGYLTTWSDPSERDYEPLDDVSSNLTIEPQRELYRAQLLQGLSEPLLGQVFSLKDLYVPPVGKLLASQSPASDGERQQAKPAEPQLQDVLDWATAQLTQADRIPVIEATPGEGKTSFCQMFAVRIAQDFYPAWMPIVISLRGLTLGATLEETLAPALPSGLFTAQESWLSAQNPPAVLLLDGLDELPLGPDGESQVSQFLWQLKAFQRRYQTDNSYGTQNTSGYRDSNTGSSNPRHRIFLTTQPETFDMLLRAHPELNLERGYRRLRLMPMGQDALRQWFRQWASLQTKAIAQSYFNFLKKGGAFRNNKSIHEQYAQNSSGDGVGTEEAGASPMMALAHQPSMLLMMAILHRDGFLDDRIFTLPSQTLDFEIFERLNFWLMGAATDAYPQPGMIADLSRSGPAHACRTPDAVANLLAGRSPRQLRREIQTLALKIYQSGRGQVALEQLEELPHIQPLPELYFWRRPLADGSPGVVFKNPALGDYNCAEAIAKRLQVVAQRTQTAYGEAFVLAADRDVAEHLYGLLGHSPLSPRLIRFVLERLLRETRREPVGVSLQVLGDRLHNFYRDYCRGRWLDEGLPQAAHLALTSLDNPYSLLQVDAVVGVNAFALLCVIARETHQPFWPCGNPQQRLDYNPNRLLQFIGRTTVLSPLAFWLYNRQHLGWLHLGIARLDNLMLAKANLARVDCREATMVGIDLEGADLREADLSQSNLRRANLEGADLRGANLSGADLRWANLTGAKLAGANFANACLAHVHLDSEGMAVTQEAGAFFSATEFHVLQALSQQEDSGGALHLEGASSGEEPAAGSVYGNETLAVEPRVFSAIDTANTVVNDRRTEVYQAPAALEETEPLGLGAGGKKHATPDSEAAQTEPLEVVQTEQTLESESMEGDKAEFQGSDDGQNPSELELSSSPETLDQSHSEPSQVTLGQEHKLATVHQLNQDETTIHASDVSETVSDETVAL